MDIPTDAGVPTSVGVEIPPRTSRAFDIEGIVQGVGFRPFVYRLAIELGLDGAVRNVAGRVEVDLWGPVRALEDFGLRVRTEAPPRARVERVQVAQREVLPVGPGTGIRIEESVAAASAVRLFPPDIATCDDCLRELFDPADRRFRYPFINCTNCGPRATIIEELPYDRAQTSMRDFPLCPACEREYRDPLDRRFHAEPVACAVCGPRLAWRRPGDATATATGDAALDAALVDLRAGRIVAVKGLGGYHLACLATDEAVVARLRDRKRRWAKPFAVMVRSLAAARRLARISNREAELLVSPARPIVLVRARDDGRPALAASVSNGDRRIGLFLPYTPLHHLLMAALDEPVVLTSGNLSDEPLATDDEDALNRLAGIADSFLLHDRRIRARYDDSVTRVVGADSTDERESIIRRGRGYAPDPLDLPVRVPDGTAVLAVGAELKHTFTLASGARAHVGPHTGDLEDLLTHQAFQDNLAHLSRLLAIEPEWVTHDLHPAYLSTQLATDRFPAARRITTQHHHAHVASCAAEHGLTRSFVGVAYDGLGMGDDDTFWGGEVLIADLAAYRRVARFGRAPMPGGALAVKKPYRMALGYLFGVEGEAGAVGLGAEWRELAEAFLGRLDPREVEVVRLQVQRGLNAPVASSAGRLFDAVSSLLGLRDIAEFEAQAAIDLETVAAGPEGSRVRGGLPWVVDRRAGLLVYDPRPTLEAVLSGVADGVASGVLAARFQHTIADITRELVSVVAREAGGIRDVCLSGGVFQNAALTDAIVRGLLRDGFHCHLNERVPANDGGISYGQAAIAAARLGGGARRPQEV
jgi:hydrogenase maturation protein HypF